MNAPWVPAPLAQVAAVRWRLVSLADCRAAVEQFVANHPDATPFHRPAWLSAVERGTGNPALALVGEDAGGLVACLPLHLISSPIFGRVLAASGFAVGGGVLAALDADLAGLWPALEEAAMRLAVPAIELRGGVLPEGRPGWRIRRDTHAGFIRPLAADGDAELLAIPRKQRAEVRKGLAHSLAVEAGNTPRDRAAHGAVYATSVRNLGTPVFPRALFNAVLDAFGEDADILTIRHAGAPVASVLSLYHRGTVMPYWGGGTAAARRLRANDVMYFALMRHAHARGCTHFDFGRSKSGSGAFDFKRNWGFEPVALAYASWSAPGAPQRDADPTSATHARQIALWKRLPLPVANTIGPWIARGLG